MCPALPDAPCTRSPSRIRPPPTPVETTMPSMLRVPRPAPRQCSPAVRQMASLCTRTGTAPNRSASRSRSGKPRQAGMLIGDTTPAGHSIGPPQPQPRPASCRLAPSGRPAASSTRVTSASTVRHRPSASRSRRVGVCSQDSSRPPGATSPAASLVPPMSTASAGRSASATASRLPRCAKVQLPHSVEELHSTSEEVSVPAPSVPPAAATVGQLRASDHKHVSVKQEMRQNLLARLRAGEDPFPGIIGFGQTVLPQLERSLIAGHDVILLGERGQGKTRLIRTLTGLLDEWTPVIEGCEINDHPFEPVCARCRRLSAELGDELPVAWQNRDDRYGEKLATPDTSVGDLIGDIDPVKVAEGRTLGDPETIHYGLVPRTNRGVFCL